MRVIPLIIAAVLSLVFNLSADDNLNLRFILSFEDSLYSNPVTGRAYVMLSKTKNPEPRLQAGNWFRPISFFGTDIEEIEPGGWISLALQVFHPDFFGGTWIMAPDPVDFRAFQMINIYKDKNAFIPPNSPLKNERPLARTSQGQVLLTVRQFSQMELVKGTKSRSGDQLDAFFAVFGPVGEDGYPKPLFDKVSGEIDTTVAQYYKEHFDLRYYMEKNWEWLGSKLVGKLHFICGDMDNFYLNQALYKLEEFLESTTEPYYEGSFVWGRPNKGHCWSPWGRDYVKFFDMIDRYLRQNKSKL